MNAHPGMEESLIWLFTHSLQAGVLVLVVLLIQWIFRRQLTSRWRFALWWIVLARLLLPFNPESALSLFNFVQPNVRLERPVKSEPVPPSMPAEIDAGPITPAAVRPAPTVNQPASVALVPDSPTFETSPSVPAAGTPRNSLSVTDLLIPALAAVWLAGVVGLMGAVVAQLFRFYGKLARTTTAGSRRASASLAG